MTRGDQTSQWARRQVPTLLYLAKDHAEVNAIIDAAACLEDSLAVRDRIMRCR